MAKIYVSHQANIPRLHALGIAAALWLWASQFSEDGELSKYDKSEIAKGIHWDGSPDELFNALVESKLLDQQDTKILIHDWDKHGVRLLKQSRERQKRYREKESKNDGRVQHAGSAALNAAKAALPRQ